MFSACVVNIVDGILESVRYIRIHDRAFDIVHIIDNLPCCPRDGTQTAWAASVFSEVQGKRFSV